MVNIFTEKASCCCSLTTAVNTLLLLTLLLRLAGVTCGCFYGPYLYLVVSIGGLYLAGESQPSDILNDSFYFQRIVFSSGLSTGERRRENSCATSPARKCGFLSGKLATSWESLGFLSPLVSQIFITAGPAGLFECPQVGILPVSGCGRCSTLRSTSLCSSSSVPSYPLSSTLPISSRLSTWYWVRPTLTWVSPLSVTRSMERLNVVFLVYAIAGEREGLLWWRHGGGGTIRLQKNFSVESREWELTRITRALVTRCTLYLHNNITFSILL